MQIHSAEVCWACKCLAVMFAGFQLKSAGFQSTRLGSAKFKSSRLRLAGLTNARLRSAELASPRLRFSCFKFTQLRSAWLAVALSLAEPARSRLRLAGFKSTRLMPVDVGCSQICKRSAVILAELAALGCRKISLFSLFMSEVESSRLQPFNSSRADELVTSSDRPQQAWLTSTE